MIGNPHHPKTNYLQGDIDIGPDNKGHISFHIRAPDFWKLPYYDLMPSFQLRSAASASAEPRPGVLGDVLGFQGAPGLRLSVATKSSTVVDIPSGPNIA